jgi:TP901 family phage tail tape measure protein
MATAPVTVNANLNFNPASINAAGKQVQSAFGNINLPTKAVNNFNNSLGRITGQASEFDKSINAATARVFAFGAAVSIINGLSTAFKALVSSTIEVEKRLTEIGSILGGTTEQLGQFKNAIFDVAKNTGQTFSTVADAASELARQGLSAEETVKRLNAALILTRVSGLDAEGSVNALTSAINGFTSAGLTAEQIVNKLIAVDTAFAVSAKDLAEAFSRAGSTAEDAGVSFDELLGLVTSVQQTTARGGAVIGNAFKSIFSRLSRGTVIEDLKALGVQIDSSQTGVQKLQALSQALSNISDPTQANAIKELAGGVYQINVVSAALKDLSSETSIFARASQTAGQASNEAFEKNAQLNQTLAAQINKLVQGLTELGSKIGELTIAPVIENLLTGANKLLDILNKVFDPEEGNKLIQGFFKGIGAFIAGPGLVLVSAAFFKLFQVVAKFAKEGISDLFKIGSEQERIKNIEGGIVALLQQDANLRATLLSTSTTQAQKEQAVINAIKQQNALLTQQQALVNSIATAAAKAGVGGFSPSGGFTNKKGKGKFAAGYSGNVSPQEAAMEMAAANQHGYKAGKVKKERIFDGTGSSFLGILNSAETREDFINARGYKSTLITPPNGFAAGGFVPNYSKAKTAIPKKPKKSYDEMSPTTLNGLLKTERDADKKAAIEAALANKEKRLLIPSSLTDPFPFLIPSGGYIGDLNNKKAGTGEVLGKKIPYELQSKGQIRSAFPIYTSEVLEKADSPYDVLLEEKITKNLIDTAVNYSKILSPPSELKGIEEKITARVSEQKGAKGAIISAVGSAFEAAITAALGIDQAESDYGADFDVPQGYAGEGRATLSTLFGIENDWKGAEFKATGSAENINSYISKIIRVNGLHLSEKERKTTPKKAAGFIPNFAALNDAVSREMAAGVPRDKIYIDQNNSLKSPFNTEGLMVANRDDEPNGGKQGIKRAISEGKNPKTYGQNFAARGFIPNYASGGIGGFLKASPAEASRQIAEAAAAEASKKVAAAANKASDSLDDIGDKSDKASSSFGRVLAAVGSLNILIYSFLPSLQGFAQGIKLDEEALASETKKRREAVRALEEETKKGGKANQEVITRLNNEIKARDESIENIENSAEAFGSSVGSVTTSVLGFGSILSILPFESLFGGIKNANTAFNSAASAVSSTNGKFGKFGSFLSNLSKSGSAIPVAGAVVTTAAVSVGAGYAAGKAIDEVAEELLSIPNDLESVKLGVKDFSEQVRLSSTSLTKYKLALDAINVVFENGYQTIKIATDGIRSEFQKLNDEAGITGINSKITESENRNQLTSGARDIVAQQNLRKTTDPFEKQKIIRDREVLRQQEASDAGKVERVGAADVIRTGQENFLTGISNLFTEGITKDLFPDNKTFDEQGNLQELPIKDRVFSKDTEADKEARTKGSNTILDKDFKESRQFAKDLEKRASTASTKSQTELFNALKNLGGAAEALINSTPRNQKENLERFTNAQSNLKPILEERAKSQGEDSVSKLNEDLKNYQNSIMEGVKAQTASFIKENAEREKINLDSLVKQKEVLDQFIDNFNASFLQNAQTGASLFAEALASGKNNTINENITNLKGAGLGTGMADASTFQQRQEALIQTTSQLESSGFFKTFKDPNEEATFRTQLAREQLGGVDTQTLQKGLNYQSGNLRDQAQELDKDPGARNAIASSTQGFAEVLKKLREEAVKAGDTNLTRDVDQRLSTLNNPNATVDQKVAAGNVNLEGTKLSEEAQTEYQRQLIGAAGAIQSTIDSLKGESVARASDALGIQIEGVASNLTLLKDALNVTVDDVPLAGVIKEITTSSQGLTPIIDSFKGTIGELEKAVASKTETLEKYNNVEKGLLSQQQELVQSFNLSIKEMVATLNPIGLAVVSINKIVDLFDIASRKAELFAKNFPEITPDPTKPK